MEPFRHHVYVCDQQKAEGAPCCSARGSGAVLDSLRREIAAQGLSASVQVTTCGSLGLCERGPNLVVYPEGDWYSGVRARGRAGDRPRALRPGPSGRTPPQRAPFRASSRDRRPTATGRWPPSPLGTRRASCPDEIAGPLRAFMESRVLLTALELDVFTAVGAGATAAAVAVEPTAPRPVPPSASSTRSSRSGSSRSAGTSSRTRPSPPGSWRPARATTPATRSSTT